MTKTSSTVLSADICEKIDRWMLRYPPEQKRSAVMEALRLVQEDNGGNLTEALMNAVADYLGMARIAVYEVATFYTMYNLAPVGQHVINVCTNISCMLSDSEKMLEHLKERLGIGLNETTVDGKFTLREVECLAACANAPVAQIGKHYYENLTTDKLDALLDKLGS